MAIPSSIAVSWSEKSLASIWLNSPAAMPSSTMVTIWDRQASSRRVLASARPGSWRAISQVAGHRAQVSGRAPSTEGLGQLSSIRIISLSSAVSACSSLSLTLS
jgi:hypothetical protein